jgi:hypothetical protein
VIQNLGTTQTYEYTISSKDYSDSLSFAVDRSMMDPLDPQNNIKISVEPEDLVITDQDQIIKVNVQVETLSPSFSQSDVKFTLIGLAGDQKIATKLDIPVQVNPIFEITMEGSNNVVYSPNLTEYSFRPHQNGLKIIYKKPDTANIVHGNGIIPHQRIATPSPDYEVTIMPNVANCTGSFYSHNNEGGGNARRVRCNVQ